MTRMLYEELEYDEETGQYTHAGVPFDGIAYTLSPLGWVQSEQSLRSGLPWGIGRTWHRPDQLAAEIASAGGVWHGKRMEWHSNGRLAVDELLELGITLWRKTWDEEGRILENYVLSEGDGDFETLQILRKHNQDDRWTNEGS